jgi:hypothetical protein
MYCQDYGSVTYISIEAGLPTVISVLSLANPVATAEVLGLSWLNGFAGRATLDAPDTCVAVEPTSGGTEEANLAARGNSEASL